MQKLTLFVFLLIVANATYSQQNASKKKLPEEQVKQYWFVMLTKGSSRNQDSTTAANLQAGHMANIKRLYDEGKLKVAGPFGDDGDWRGIFIFDCANKQEVETLLKTDPAVKAGRLNYEIHSWWTSPTGSFTPGKPKQQ